MENLTPRQAQILAAVVREYSKHGEPVGSEDLAQKYRLGVSSATVRNEMQALEKSGLITQPHTSAGRVPTDRGYRYFVSKLMHHLALSTVEQNRLKQELAQLQRQYLELGRGLSKLLAQHAEGATFTLLPESVTTSGLAKVLQEDVRREELRELAEFLEELQDHSQALLNRDFRAVQTFIGKEAPIPLASDFSLVVTNVLLPSGEKGLIGIVGLKRMKYARNISLLEYISKLLSSGLALFLIIFLNGRPV